MSDETDAEETLDLLVGGKLYGGWLVAGATLAMDAVCGTYSLKVTDRWAPDTEPWEINRGDECQIKIGRDSVVKGYVNAIDLDWSATSHGINIQGRDKAQDMVDCSAIHDPDEWRNITILALAEILAKPFGVSVKAEVDVGAPIDLVKLQQGETAVEALMRYAKMRKILVMPDGSGGILLTRTGTTRAEVELIQGVNILEARGSLDDSDRFSDYIVKGQANFSDDSDGPQESHVLAKSKDTGIKRYRPMMVICDTEANGATAQARADWEANGRVGGSGNATITVQGWRQKPGGKLWWPNLLVKVSAPWLRMDGEMLIKQVTFSKGDDGTTTQLDLVSPQSFEPEPPDGEQKKKQKKAKSKKKEKLNPWDAALADDAGDYQDDDEGEGDD